MALIREERREDAPGVQRVLVSAFETPVEARLVALLRERGKVTLSLVALQDEKIVGHILFSPVTLYPPRDGLKMVGLAPVAVLPELQGQGIGSELIRKGLEGCARAGLEIVVVLGDPGFYSRFGFCPARDLGLGNEYGVDEEFMALELRSGCLAPPEGTVRYQPEFREAEVGGGTA